MLTILSFLPNEAWVLAFIVLALSAIVGVTKVRTVGLFLIAFAMLPLVDAVIEALFGILPMWLIILLAAWTIASLVRYVMRLLLGRHAADAALGHLVALAIVGAFRMAGRLGRSLFLR